MPAIIPPIPKKTGGAPMSTLRGHSTGASWITSSKMKRGTEF